MKNLTKKQITHIVLLAVSVVVVAFGLMFMLTAAKLVPIFTFMYGINNILGQYVIVIATMIVGIMTFSNVSLLIENDKIRNGLTIGVTTFSTVLTVPLVYVFVAIFFAHNGILGPVGEIMMLGDIVAGFTALFGNGAFVYVVYSVMFVVSIIFITFPLVTGVLAVKGKAIIVGKQDNGKFGVGIGTLPVLAKK